MKKITSLALVVAMVFAMAATTVVPGTAASEDPADSYVVQTAPYEDSDISMWFTHSTVKTLQHQTESSGRDTYSIYMAKNEIQGAHVILYSPTVTKRLITAAITDFTAMDGSGATITSEINYEFYVQTSGLNPTDFYGVTEASQSIIKEGMTPDAIAPVGSINAGRTTLGKFTLTAGKTQALYFTAKTAIDTPSGWYSAQIDIKDTDGNVIKTATVYTYMFGTLKFRRKSAIRHLS